MLPISNMEGPEPGERRLFMAEHDVTKHQTPQKTAWGGGKGGQAAWEMELNPWEARAIRPPSGDDPTPIPKGRQGSAQHRMDRPCPQMPTCNFG